MENSSSIFSCDMKEQIDEKALILIDWNASYFIGQNVKLKCKHGPFIDQVQIVSLVPSVNIWDVKRANWKANYDTKELIGCKN